MASEIFPMDNNFPTHHIYNDMSDPNSTPVHVMKFMKMIAIGEKYINLPPPHIHPP